MPAEASGVVVSKDTSSSCSCSALITLETSTLDN